MRDKPEERLQGGARRGPAKRSVSIHWRLGLPGEAGKQQQEVKTQATQVSCSSQVLPVTALLPGTTLLGRSQSATGLSDLRQGQLMRLVCFSM